MIIKTPFVERISFVQDIYDGCVDLSAYDTDGNSVHIKAVDKSSDECKITYTINNQYSLSNQYKDEETLDYRVASKFPADAVKFFQEYAEYLFDFGYEKGIIIQPDVPVDELAELVEKRFASLEYAGQSFRIRNFPEKNVYTDFAYMGDGKCDITIGIKGNGFAVCNELPIETIKKDVFAINIETLPFNRIIGLGKTDPTPVKLGKLIMQAKEENKFIDEIYRIEGDTLIINDGVTAIDGRDFHIYDENEDDEYPEYSSIKDGFEDIKKVIVPDSVVQIGYDAFYGFWSLEDISLPNSITSIDYDAFGLCANLKSVTIPDGVTSIGGFVFSDCENLTSVSISNNVASIGDWAFADCERLTSITIPDSVKSIGMDAFTGCESLTSITIPDSVTNIGKNAFEDCENLTIVCDKGSYAETYAKENDIPVKYIKDKAKSIERE